MPLAFAHRNMAVEMARIGTSQVRSIALRAGGTVAWSIVAWSMAVCGVSPTAKAQGTTQAANATAARELVPALGTPYAAELVAVDASWQLTVQGDRGQGTRQFTLPAADLGWWGAPVEPASRRGVRPTDRVWVLLADGGLLVADVLALRSDRVTLGSIVFGEFDLRLNQVQGILFRPPADAARRDNWMAKIRDDGNASEDRLLLANGDVLRGSLAGWNENGIAFTSGGLELPPIPAERVAAIVIRHDELNATLNEGLRAWIGFTDGSRLLASSIVVREGQLEAVAAGHTFQSRALRLCWLQPLGGRIVYLSDLTAAGYRHVPFLNQSWPYHRDANVLGQPLRAQGRWYAKGLGLHTRSRLTYALEPGHREFAAEVALDDAAGPEGSVSCYVFVGRELKYRSPILRAGDPPVSVRVPLDENSESLTLVVDFAERGDMQDYVDWLNARLIE